VALDSTGFKRKRFAELVLEMEEKAKEAFGAQINTSERSPIGIILRLYAWFLSLSWQNAEDVYNSGYINTATRASLSRLGPYVGIQRIQAMRATGSVTFTGTSGYTVPAGFRIATSSGVLFEIADDVTLASGTGDAPIRAVTAGRSGNVAAGQITIIVNPTPSVTAVTNAAETGGGREVETDTEFRDRFRLSVAGGGAATLDSIRGALLRVSGVRAATVIENYTSTADGDGRPPKSFEAYVLGGEPSDIGQTILAVKAAGIQPWGSESVIVQDDGGFGHEMKFSYADEVTAHIRMTVSTDVRFPADGAAQLTSAVIRYVGGEDADGSVYVGLNMGEGVVISRLISAAYSVEGIVDVAIELSTDGTTWGTSNLSIAANEVAQTAHGVITVVIAS